MATFQVSQKGRVCMYFNGFKFTRNKENFTTETEYWICANSTCKCTAVTRARVLTKFPIHVDGCVPNAAVEEIDRLKAQMKQRVAAEPLVAVKRIYEDTTNGVLDNRLQNEIVAKLPCFQSLERTLYR